MRFGETALCVLGGMLFSLAPIFAAQAQQKIPSFTILHCAENCGDYRPPEAISKFDHSTITLPSRLERGQMSEVLVDLNFVIGANGKVKNVLVENVIGAAILAEAIRESAKEWVFSPATRKGVPVEGIFRGRYGIHVRYMGGTFKFGKRRIASAYNDANALVESKQHNAAIPVLLNILGEEKLSFFERAMTSNLLSHAYAATGEIHKAYYYSHRVMIMGLNNLSSGLQAPAVNSYIRLALSTGQIGDASLAAEILEMNDPPPPDDPLRSVLSESKALVNSRKTIGVDAVILPEAGKWQHALLRRSFAFDDIRGKLDRFILRCKQQSIESEISDEAQWNIPKSFSDCNIFVYGAPGTRFQFVEMAGSAMAYTPPGKKD